MKKIRMMMAAALAILASCSTTKSGESTANPLSSKVIVAYVTSWSNIVPEPQYMTHINYAFGHVNESFDGVRIDNEERLKQIVDLKKQNPELKVLLSVAGMEGALASVVGGLTDKPVIAVPTSVGYGANFGGLSALLTMLNSCASGVGVVNIDNGFGAAMLASMINKL